MRFRNGSRRRSAQRSEDQRTTQTAAPAAYSGQAAVGKTIDGDIVWQEAPNYPKYHWARLNGQRVVVDDSHKVVAVY